MGRLKQTTMAYSFVTGNPFTIVYGYDAGSNRKTMTDPQNGQTTYTYDTLNRLSNIFDFNSNNFGFNYDALSRRTQLTRPNGINTNYGYDSVSNLLSIQHQQGVNTLDGASYTYDSAGNRKSKSNLLNGATSNFSYDNVYQLTGVTGPNPESYTYDPVGNRLTSQTVSNYSYNNSNELTAAGSASYTYDANGNTLTKTDSTGTTTYGWDFENRLISVQLPSSTTVTFKYDPFGRRMQKSGASVTNYVYDGANAIEEVDASENLLAKYSQGAGIDEPLSESRSGATSYYEQDGLGSVTSLSSTGGVMANTYVYDSFGNLTNSSGTVVNPYQYTGRDYDPETGLRYYRARYYDPTTGRFLNEDPIRYGEGINFYYYVRNSPSTWNDPSGLIHQAWNEPPFDGRLHDDPGAGLEVLCTKGRNIQRDIAWLEHSIQIRMAEILKLGKDADAGHHDRLDAELATLAHCRSECDKDKKPDPETEPFDVPDTWLIRADIWLYERWEELKRALKRGPQGPGPGPAPGPAPGPGPVPVPVATP
jgi:RHS repeat-associated protein